MNVLIEQAQHVFSDFENISKRLPDAISQLNKGDRFRQVHDILTVLVIVQEEVVELRLNKILRAEHPYLPPIDINSLIEIRRTKNASIQELTDEFLKQRKSFLKLLGNLSPETWERTGFHEVEGHLTFRELVRRMNEKDGALVRKLDDLISQSATS